MSQLICAAATPPYSCAIGILRLSGAGAAAAVDALFTPRGGGTLSERPAGRMVLGTLHDAAGAVLDEIQAVRYTRGYTGEESAELFCHGSPQVLTLAMEALLAQGARSAGPGEFTRRAFLNGTLDLAQAEAVMDLIDAPTPGAARQAAGQLTGALSRRVERIYGVLADLLAHFHAVLDYPDEDIDPFTAATIAGALEAAQGELKALLATYERGRVVREGLPTAIVGRPNVGKSTLLNTLVGYERAIVTDIPGTTRDTVEETCVLGGVLLRLTDTAGMRATTDPVERLGVERARAAMEGAGLILVVLDRSLPAREEDMELVRLAAGLAPTVAVLNKADLPAGPAWEELEPVPACAVCAKTGQGLEELARLVAGMFPQGEGAAGELLTNARQAEAAGRALEGVARAGEALRAGVTPDAVLTEVEGALSALGELTGRTVREDVTQRIFERFCVGK